MNLMAILLIMLVCALVNYKIDRNGCCSDEQFPVHVRPPALLLSFISLCCYFIFIYSGAFCSLCLL